MPKGKKQELYLLSSRLVAQQNSVHGLPAGSTASQPATSISHAFTHVTLLTVFCLFAVRDASLACFVLFGLVWFKFQVSTEAIQGEFPSLSLRAGRCRVSWGEAITSCDTSTAPLSTAVLPSCRRLHEGPRAGLLPQGQAWSITVSALPRPCLGPASPTRPSTPERAHLTASAPQEKTSRHYLHHACACCSRCRERRCPGSH